jgi:hypothetical protein
MTVAQRISMLRLMESLQESAKYNDNVVKTEYGYKLNSDNGSTIIEIAMVKPNK